MRTLATVQKITALDPIHGADKIERATVLGWQCVVKKGDFKVGDKCIYIEVDSIMPEKPEYEFLRERKFRIKTIKLRGQVSSGLCLPCDQELPEGLDLTDKLGIRKYDPQGDKERMEAERAEALHKSRLRKFLMRNSLFQRVCNWLFKENRGGWPAFIKKTDEERIQKMPQLLTLGLRYDVTEKLDGQSGTYFCVRKGWRKKFGVCSRNFQLCVPDNSTYWRVAYKYKLMDKLPPGYVLQGEILGPKVQGNKYRVGDVEFYAFNLVIHGHRMDTVALMAWCQSNNIPHVPVLALDAALPESMEQLVAVSRGFSVKNPLTVREGLVYRNYEKNISFKVINPEFLLTHED